MRNGFYRNTVRQVQSRFDKNASSRNASAIGRVRSRALTDILRPEETETRSKMFRSNRSENEAVSRDVRREKCRLLSARLRVFLPGDLNRKPSSVLSSRFVYKTKIARWKAKESLRVLLEKMKFDLAALLFNVQGEFTDVRTPNETFFKEKLLSFHYPEKLLLKGIL